MSGLVGNPFLLASAAGGATGYQIERSLRFNSSDSAYCSRVPSTAGNRKTWTWSGWVKKVKNESILPLLNARQSSSDFLNIWFDSGDGLFIRSRVGGSDSFYAYTAAVFRDPSAWYHVLIAVDTTQASSSNGVKVYVNGTQQTLTIPTYNQNADTYVNSTFEHRIGYLINQNSSTYYLDSYLADLHLIDGQQLDPSSFVAVSATTGQLIPKAYTGSFGTNGFWLKFSDNSATTATTLGRDYSGNSNNWTPNNFSVTAGAGNDSLVDTPTSYGTDTGAGGEVRGNYSTWGAPYAGAAGLSNGNLDFLAPTTMNAFGSISVTSGKWYWEILNSGTGLSYVGIMDSTITTATDTSWSTQSRAYVSGGSKYNGSSSSYGSSWAAGDVIGFALDLDSNSLTFYKNGVSQGVAFSTGLIGKEWKPFVYGSSGSGCSANFGQRSWAYAAPAGFKALCDTNLPAPVVAKSSDYFQTVLYTGNGSTQTISGLGFSPDLVWIKCRSTGSTYHSLYDIVRGAYKRLSSNVTDAEYTYATTGLTAFSTSSFTVADDTAGSDNVNGAVGGTYSGAAQYAAWCWDAGSSTVTNTQGSITSQVRANASAGFSIVTYSGNSSTATVGHGLNVAPSWIIIKNRTSAYDWIVYANESGTLKQLYLNLTLASSGSGLSLPSSTTFNLPGGGASGSNETGKNYVAYCFAPVAGYSSFGSYTGNGSADGPFVFTGHRSRWLLIKNSSASENWRLHDTARSPYNVMQNLLFPNLSNAETTSSEYNVDILSNGFKIRANTAGSLNDNGSVYVWASFAENPFQYARAR